MYKGIIIHISGAKEVTHVLAMNEKSDISKLISTLLKLASQLPKRNMRNSLWNCKNRTYLISFLCLRKQGRCRYFFMRWHPELTLKLQKILFVYWVTYTNTMVVENWFQTYGKLLKDNYITSGLFVWNINDHSEVDNPRMHKVVGMTCTHNIMLASN